MHVHETTQQDHRDAISALIEAALTQDEVSTQIPASDFDALKNLSLAMLTGQGNKIISGVTYDPTSTPAFQIVEQNGRAVLQVGGINLDIDTSQITAEDLGEKHRPFLPIIQGLNFKGKLQIKRLGIANKPPDQAKPDGIAPLEITGYDFDVVDTEGNPNVGAKVIIAMALPAILKDPQKHLQDILQDGMIKAAAAHLPALPARTIDALGIRITTALPDTGTPGLQISLRSHAISAA